MKKRTVINDKELLRAIRQMVSDKTFRSNFLVSSKVVQEVLAEDCCRMTERCDRRISAMERRNVMESLRRGK